MNRIKCLAFERERERGGERKRDSEGEKEMERRREGERDRKKERKGEGYIYIERDIVRWTEGREIEGGIRREKYERDDRDR